MIVNVKKYFNSSISEEYNKRKHNIINKLSNYWKITKKKTLCILEKRNYYLKNKEYQIILTYLPNQFKKLPEEVISNILSYIYLHDYFDKENTYKNYLVINKSIFKIINTYKCVMCTKGLYGPVPGSESKRHNCNFCGHVLETEKIKKRRKEWVLSLNKFKKKVKQID